ncbi:MAG: hypothetical protein M1836_003239 [Candelina mexicana]|nr:MAG: hypothetical protein M1836_003239 [Candelina mexicana]
MPPRKSDASKAATGDEGTPGKDKDGISVEELALPKTMVMRLAKGVLPANTQIQKDAILAMSKSATVFVNYLASHAQEYTERANKKTIMPKDVLDAISELEFENFLPRLEAELASRLALIPICLNELTLPQKLTEERATEYNEVQTGKRNSYRRKIKEEKAASNGTPPSGLKGAANGDLVRDEVHSTVDKDSPPAAKRPRTSTLNGVEPSNGNAASTSSEDGVGRSGDDTMSDHDSELEAEADDADNDHEGSAGTEGEYASAEDGLGSQKGETLEDEALDNGDDSE